MKTKTFAEIQEVLDGAELSSLPTLRISILRNIMLEPIVPYLRYEAFRIGLNAEIQLGEFDNVYQEAVGGNSDQLNSDTEVVLAMLYLPALSPQLSGGFAGMSAREIKSESDRLLGEAEAIVAGIRNQTDGMILWHGFERSLYPSLGIFDGRSEMGENAAIEKLNHTISDYIRSIPNAYFIDSNLSLMRTGEDNYFDARFWHIGRAPYTREALRQKSQEIYKFIRALKGKNKKCLALDCDNTLWGGVLGEESLSGIKIGPVHPGSSFQEFQREILNLYHRGVILALCSKNNEEDVWDVFKKHPDMLLRENHIATAQINWNDKASNLRKIASDLNIGLDSIVFVDDSDFEVNLVRQELPEVAVIHLPKNQPTNYRSILSTCGLFDTLTLSEEDKKRGEMYKAESTRKKLQVTATDMDSYYRSLEMIAEVRLATEFSIPRISQQTQKTNQFNLTTRRYSEADIKRLADSKDSDVLSLKLTDRFGDSGIVGTCILKYIDEVAVFDSFLLSCRILGRGVEDLFLIEALKLARKQGCSSAIGEYFATKKNSQVERFFPDRGFVGTIDNPNSADGRYSFDLSNELSKEADYFKEIISDV